jgi:hypothetical protein
MSDDRRFRSFLITKISASLIRSFEYGSSDKSPYKDLRSRSALPYALMILVASPSVIGPDELFTVRLKSRFKIPTRFMLTV